MAATLALFGSLLFTACQTMNDYSLEPASSALGDVFTCKGLSTSGHWLEVTEVFDPKGDPRVVVVAQLSHELRQGRIIYELISPNGAVAFTEKRSYPKQAYLGLWWSIDQLMERGGEGYWKVNVYSDWTTVGQIEFRVGEPPEGEEEGVGRYLMVTEESDGDLTLEPVSDSVAQELDAEFAEPSPAGGDVLPATAPVPAPVEASGAASKPASLTAPAAPAVQPPAKP